MKAAVHGAVTRRVVRRPEPAAGVAWSTPALLRLGLYGALCTSLLMLAAALTGAFTARDALRIIGREAAPGVFAAEHIRGMLADMDQSAVAELLSKTADPAVFETRRQAASDAIIRATEDISYRDLERVPLQKLGLGFGSYTAQIQQARDEYRSGDKRYLEAYRRAANIMDSDLQPSVDRLEKSMRDILESSYDRERKLLEGILLSLVCSALLTGGILVYLQVFVATRMRRVLNPLLFAATLLTIVFSGYSAGALQRESSDLRFAKEGPFAQESEQLETSALTETAALAGSRRKLDSAHFAIQPDSLAVQPDALAAKTESPAPGNVVPFDNVIERGFQEVSNFEFSAPAATVLIVLFTFLGILPRLREYSV